MKNFIRKPNCKCKECSKEIYRRPFQLEKGDVYCSSKCANVRNKKEDIACPCGKVIPRRKHAKTCSRSCSNKYRTGTKYKIGQPKNNATKSQRLKNALLKVREPKCNRCHFNIVEILHVHHIVERSNGGSDAYDNLELLCPNCHAIHHYLTKTTMND